MPMLSHIHQLFNSAQGQGFVKLLRLRRSAGKRVPLPGPSYPCGTTTRAFPLVAGRAPHLALACGMRGSRESRQRRALPPIPTLARLRRRRAVRPFPSIGGKESAAS
jgi:hypothetical protein